MRPIISVFLFMQFGFLANAQMRQGDWFLGLQNHLQHSFFYGEASGETISNAHRFFVGRFFTESLMLGAKGIFRQSMETRVFNQQLSNINYYVLESSLFVRPYLQLTKGKNPLNLYGSLGLELHARKIKNDPFAPTGKAYSKHLLYAYSEVGLNRRVAPGLHLELELRREIWDNDDRMFQQRSEKFLWLSGGLRLTPGKDFWEKTEGLDFKKGVKTLGGHFTVTDETSVTTRIRDWGDLFADRRSHGQIYTQITPSFSWFPGKHFMFGVEMPLLLAIREFKGGYILSLGPYTRYYPLTENRLRIFAQAGGQMTRWGELRFNSDNPNFIVWEALPGFGFNYF